MLADDDTFVVQNNDYLFNFNLLMGAKGERISEEADAAIGNQLCSVGYFYISLSRNRPAAVARSA